MTFKNHVIQNRALRFFRENGFNVVYLEAQQIDERKILVKGIAEASSANTSILKMEVALKNIENVLDVKIRKMPFNETAFFLSFYPPVMAGIPMIILRAKHFSQILNSLKEKWGSAGEVALYYLGEMAGSESYETLSQLFNVRGIELAKIKLALAKSYGWWSEAKIVDYDSQDGRVVIRIYDSIECRYVKSQRPNGQFIRGYLAGFFSKIVNMKMEAVEKCCISNGDSYCEYYLTVKDLQKHKIAPMQSQK